MGERRDQGPASTASTSSACTAIAATAEKTSTAPSAAFTGTSRHEFRYRSAQGEPERVGVHSSLHSRRDDAGDEETLEGEEDGEDGDNGNDRAGRDLAATAFRS